MTYLMEHGFDHFLTVGTYVFFRKKKFQFINLLKIWKFFPVKMKIFFFKKLIFELAAKNQFLVKKSPYNNTFEDKKKNQKVWKKIWIYGDNWF